VDALKCNFLEVRKIHVLHIYLCSSILRVVVDILVKSYLLLEEYKRKKTYRKIPNISPGLIEVRIVSTFWGDYNRGAYIRGAYIRRVFCVSVQVSGPQNSLLYIAIIGKKVFRYAKITFILL